MKNTLLQINVIANSGSTGKIAEEIGIMAMQAGWRSIIAYGRWARDSRSELIRIGSRSDVLLHGLKSAFLDRHGLGSAKATKRFVKQIAEIKPDIIHLHNIHGYYLNYRILFDFLAKQRIPVVWTLHDCWSVTGHCVHFQDIGCTKWEVGCNHCPGIATGNYPKSFFADNSRRNYLEKKRCFSSLPDLTVVPVCRWLDEIVGRSYLSKFKSKVIVNGIDLDVFYPCDSRGKVDSIYGTKNKFLCLAVATNWNKTKGFDDLRVLRDLLPQKEVTIVMVGLTKKQIGTLPEGIIGIEKTENVRQLAELYSAADVFVNPTYQDTLPTVNIEAIACGTPVVTYDTGGCTDIVDGETGRIVPSGKIEMMYDGIEEIMQEGKDKYSTACRQKAERDFNKNERYCDYINLYEHLYNHRTL